MSKRRRWPQLRVIAGGGIDSGIARGDHAPGRVPNVSDGRPPEDGVTPPLPAPAGDLSLQPGLRVPDEDEFCPHYYPGEHERRRIAADVDRLRFAIVDLASIEMPPARLLEELSATFDRPVIRDRLIQAIDCLTQFAEQWRLEELSEAAHCSRTRGKSDES